jgi:hypothetical protein
VRHCSPEELMDVIDRSRAEASLPHLATCARCRQQLLEVRGMLAEVRGVPVPEPTPAQLARLSARVRDALGSESQWAQRSWWSRERWAWGVPIAAIAVLTLAIVVPGLNRPVPPVVPIAQADDSAGGQSGAAAPGGVQSPVPRARDLEARDDPSLGLMFDLAAVVDLDSDPAPVFAMGAGTLDDAVGDLSPEEQGELERLLREALERPGA